MTHKHQLKKTIEKKKAKNSEEEDNISVLMEEKPQRSSQESHSLDTSNDKLGPPEQQLTLPPTRSITIGKKFSSNRIRRNAFISRTMTTELGGGSVAFSSNQKVTYQDSSEKKKSQERARESDSKNEE